MRWAESVGDISIENRPRAAENQRTMIRIIRSRCCGSASCVEIAPDVFGLDDRGRSVVLDPDAASEETLLEAVEACPCEAIEFEDEADAAGLG